jgi:alpha-1,2-mannosyltransferase
VSDTTVRRPAGPPATGPRAGLRAWLTRAPVTTVIVAATLLALGLRIYQLARPGHLLAVGDVDDGADFGSAIWLIHGVLPYRSFVIVQPPGITLLMSPVALLSRATGSTAWAIGAARILTVAAGAAAVPLGGLLVRRRGLLPTIVTCGIIAIYPGSVQSAHTVMLEPWLVLFCLAGALAVFDGDRLAGGRRLVWGGVAFGFAGAIKAWAIIPVLVIVALCLLPRARWAAAGRFVGGVAAGFAVPVLPFFIAAPRAFYNSVVVAQLARTGTRTPLWYRLQQLTGLTRWSPSLALLIVVAVAAVVIVAGLLIAASRVAAPAPLEWFGVATAALIVAAFLVPADFYYHYSGFLAPFLGLAVGLPAGRLAMASRPAAPAPEGGTGGPAPARAAGPDWRRTWVPGLAALIIVALPLAVPRAENSPSPTYQKQVTALTAALPPGACVVSDQVSLLISANRFVPRGSGCPVILDGTGTSYALDHGQSALTSGSSPAVAAVWRRAFGAAQYLCLTPYNRLRVAWSPPLRAYLRQHFTLVQGGWAPLQLYVRNGLSVRH